MNSHINAMPKEAFVEVFDYRGHVISIERHQVSPLISENDLRIIESNAIKSNRWAKRAQSQLYPIGYRTIMRDVQSGKISVEDITKVIELT